MGPGPPSAGDDGVMTLVRYMDRRGPPVPPSVGAGDDGSV